MIMAKNKPENENNAIDAELTQEAIQEGTRETSATEPQTLKYPIEKLRASSLKLFGATVSTFDGATSGMIGEYGIEEIKNALIEWGKKEVNINGRRYI